MKAQSKPAQAVSDSAPISKERLRLWLKLFKAQSGIEAGLRRRLREQFDTTLPRFDVMSTLARAPQGLRMSQISGLLKVSNGNITGIVDRLTDDGFAVRVAVPGDRRAQQVQLTKAGIEAFDTQAVAHEDWLNEMMGSLEVSEIDQLQSLLDTMINHLENKGVHSDAQ